MQQNHKNKKKLKEQANPKKLTIPAVYPDLRYEKSNVAFTSDENVERSKEWVEFTKL